MGRGGRNKILGGWGKIITHTGFCNKDDEKEIDKNFGDKDFLFILQEGQPKSPQFHAHRPYCRSCSTAGDGCCLTISGQIGRNLGSTGGGLRHSEKKIYLRKEIHIIVKLYFILNHNTFTSMKIHFCNVDYLYSFFFK